MNLQEMFTVFKNDDRKRFEFEPKEGVKETSYTVSFYEADSEADAWIAVYLSISKRQEREKV